MEIYEELVKNGRIGKSRASKFRFLKGIRKNPEQYGYLNKELVVNGDKTSKTNDLPVNESDTTNNEVLLADDPGTETIEMLVENRERTANGMYIIIYSFLCGIIVIIQYLM
jgi:hypothetical protein